MVRSTDRPTMTIAVDLGRKATKQKNMSCAHLFILQADGPVLPSDLKGETFSHVFGTNTSR